MLFNKTPSKSEVFNDIDNHVITLFRVLQDDQKTLELQAKLKLTMFARQEHKRAGAMLRDHTWENDIDHAWAVFVKFNQSVNGIAPIKRGGWGYGKTVSTGTYWTRVYILDKIAARLRNVQIENADFRDIFRRYDGEGVFFYIDPPYSLQTREGGKVYNHEITPEDHGTLLLLLEQLKGSAILSGYKGTGYNDLLDIGWKTIEIVVKSHMKVNPGAPEKTEVLWISPGINTEPPQKPLTLFEL